MSDLDVHALAALLFGHAEAEIAAYEEECAAAEAGGDDANFGTVPGLHRWRVTVCHGEHKNSIRVNARTMRGAVKATITNTKLTLPRGGGTLSITAERVK